EGGAPVGSLIHLDPGNRSTGASGRVLNCLQALRQPKGKLDRSLDGSPSLCWRTPVGPVPGKHFPETLDTRAVPPAFRRTAKLSHDPQAARLPCKKAISLSSEFFRPGFPTE